MGHMFLRQVCIKYFNGAPSRCFLQFLMVSHKLPRGTRQKSSFISEQSKDMNFVFFLCNYED